MFGVIISLPMVRMFVYMKFQTNHKLGFVTKRERKLAKTAISFKPFEGQAEELKKIPGWQDSLREYIDRLIEDARGAEIN